MGQYENYMKEYRLARLSVQMVDAKLVKLHIEKLVEEDIKETNTNFQFFYRTGKSDKGVKGLMLVDIEVTNPQNNENLIEAQVAYEGLFVSNDTSLKEEELEAFTKEQVIPQLLPYCRSIIAMVSAQLGGKPLELPTMDVIESIIQNQRDREKSDD